MLFFPNAKINIGLNILRKRPDGYHDISSCFYPIGLRDALEIVQAPELTFEARGQGIDATGDNLVSKALDLLSRDFRIPPLSVFLLKGIPIGAGLGGGSADAAFMISALNTMFHLNLSFDQQESYARLLGSDCAFFIRNKPVYCFEKGDRFEPVDLSLKGYHLCLVHPGIHVSTAEAYSGVVPAESDFDLKAALREPVHAWREKIRNDFETSVFSRYPALPLIKKKLYEMGAEYASMSGSGSSVYGIFRNLPVFDNIFKNCFVWQGELD